VNRKEAIKIRNQYRKTLIGKPLGRPIKDAIIRDVIICGESSVAEVYTRMYDSNVPNESILTFFPAKNDDYEVFVISHEWPTGAGDLLFDRLDVYLKANPSETLPRL